VLVVPGGQGSPAFQGGEGSFDEVAAAVFDDVVADWSAAGGAAALAVAGLVGWFGDHGLDPSAAQQVPVAARGVGLVPADQDRRSAGPAGTTPSDAELVEQYRQRGTVTGLARGDKHDQRLPAAVDQQVCLAAQPAAGTPEPMIWWFVRPER
jgi:hypothetical protein